MPETAPKYPRLTIPHIRIVAGGTLGDGKQEIWSCTMKVAPFQTLSGTETAFREILSAAEIGVALDVLHDLLNGDSLQDGLQNYCDTYAVPAWKAFIGNALTQYGALTYVKCNVFGTDDKQVNPLTLDRQFTPLGGSGNGGPFTSAVVLEFRTSKKSRGLATHGRMSLPVAAYSDGSGQIAYRQNQNQATSLQAAALTFLSTLNGPSTTGHQLLPAIIYTQEVGRQYDNNALDRSPQANAIDQLMVSTLPGIIRRRGNALKQGGVLAPISYGPTTGP